MPLYRNAQGYYLGGGRLAGVAAGSLTGTLQVAALLEDPVIRSVQQGTVDTITVASQPVIASDKGMDIGAFAAPALVEGQRSLGIPLAEQQQVRITYTLAAVGTVSFGVSVIPILPEQVVPVNALGDALAYCVGLGVTVDAAGATALLPAAGDGFLRTTILKPNLLGRFGLTPEVPDMITVRSIQVNRTELLAGETNGAAGEIAAEDFAWIASDQDGLVLGYPALVNAQFIVSLHNYDGVARNCRGGAFCAPRQDSV